VRRHRTNSRQLVVGRQRHKVDGDRGDRRRLRPEALAQPVEIGQTAGVQIGVDGLRQLGLAGALVRQGEQSNDGAGSLLVTALGDQRLERPGEGACGNSWSR
jgi:hypothetical protein